MQVIAKAPAKINLTLDVVGVREDGYHLLESIMQTADRYDTLMIQKADAITLDVAGESPCPVEKNTAYKAAQVFFRHTGIAGGVAMSLTKAIPQQAGMGGGSADAAAALRALDKLYDTHLTPDELCKMGVQVGADVPFCLIGGTGFVTGIGERIAPLPALPDCHIVVAQPPEGVSTQAAYAAIDRIEHLQHPDHTAALTALKCGDLPALCRQVANVFEQAIHLPGVTAIRQVMAEFAPLCSRMTGSGSAVFAIFEEEATASACAARLQQDYATAFLCRPCRGITLETV